jgi:hypothetical protein
MRGVLSFRTPAATSFILSHATNLVLVTLALRPPVHSSRKAAPLEGVSGFSQVTP